MNEDNQVKDEEYAIRSWDGRSFKKACHLHMGMFESLEACALQGDPLLCDS
jgi:hypothetical protein